MKALFKKIFIASLGMLCFVGLQLLSSCGEGGSPLNCEDFVCSSTEVLDDSNGICDCVCAPGWTGPDCLDPEDGNCDYVTCYNGGIKESYGSEDYCYCECPPGYGGEFCEIELLNCDGVECPTGQSPDPNNDCVCTEG